MEYSTLALLVGGDRTTRSAVTSALHRVGCRVRLASNAVEAFAEAVRRRYDLMLVDMEMPGLTGLDALPYLRRCAPNTAIVAIDGGSDHEDRAIRRGAQCVLFKPVDARIVVRLLGLAIRRRGATAPEPPVRNAITHRPAWEGSLV